MSDSGQISDCCGHSTGHAIDCPEAQITALQSRIAELERQVSELEAALKELPNEVPTNWLSPLLTGQDGINIPADCRDIEKLLRGIQDRLRLRVSAAIEAYESIK